MIDEQGRGTRGSRTIVTDIPPIWLLIGVMVVVALGVGAATLTVLYRAAFEAQSERLLENVRTTNSFLEASAARQTRHQVEAPSGADKELLALVQAAHTRYERFAAGADITLTQRQGGDIVFLLKHTHEEHGKPAKVPFASRLAEPARRALRGQSGTVIGLDFRGVEVLAAYAPVAALGLGVVTKIDLTEVRAPFVRAGGIAGAVAVLFIGLGTLAFLHLTNPMLRRLAESEARFRGIAGAAQDAVIVMAPNGQVTFWNRSAERIFGYRAEEAVGRMLAELIFPARYRARHDAGVERFRQTGEGPMVGHTIEHDALTKAGHEIPIELSLAALRLGDTWHAVATIRDISERKAAEQALQENQSRFALFMDHLPAAVFIKDAQSRVLYVNQYLKTHFGAEEWEGRVICKHSPVETSERLVRDDRKALAERELELVETLKDRTGRERTFQTHKFVIPQPEERPALLGGIAWDITDTLAAAEALRRSERRYREIFEIAQEGIWLIDAEARTVEVNGLMAEMLGYTIDEMRGRHLFEFMDEEARTEAEALLDRHRRGIKEKYDFRYRTKTGASLWTMVSTAPMHDERGAYVGALGMVTDITERKRSEDALRSHEQQLRLILASTGEGIFGIDKDGRCMFANRACATLLGYDNETVLLGKRMHTLTHHTRADGSPYPVEACPTYETCRSGKRTRVEGDLLWRADGSAFPVEYQSHPMRQDGEVVGAVVTFSDMTERLAAREALRRERDFAESLIETAPVIILVLDTEGRILRFNPFMAELTGYRLEEVQGKDWLTTFLPERERPRIQAVFREAISDLPAPRYVNPILTRTGQERLIEWHNKTLKDAQG
nr:PAS domain S-box protein [Gammaproteobacteria bacterium]